MNKIFTLFSAALISATAVMAQSPSVPSAEQAPNLNGNGNQNPTPQAPWQVLFSHDITAGGAGTGNAGVVLIGSEFWVSKWGSDTISNFSLLGTLISSFTVAGVTGVRSLTTDGTNVYAGANTASIYNINPVTKTLTSTISVPSVPNVRYCTYDPTTNGGTGGFWVGTWTTDFTQVDMTGSVQSAIGAGSHGLTATYGLAFDNTSPGGPYVWAFHQTGTTSNADIMQVNVNTGLQTGAMHDVTADMGVAGDLAGGLFFQPTPTTALVGVLQGAANLLFSYDVAGVIGINDHIAPVDMISVSPNPSSDMINIRVKRENNDLMQIRIVDMLGNVVSSSNNVAINNYYNIANYEAGVYFAQVTYNGQVYTTKIVKN
jgi:hypothetical protein